MGERFRPSGRGFTWPGGSMEAKPARPIPGACRKKTLAALLLGCLLTGCRNVPHEVALPPQTSDQALLDRVIPASRPSAEEPLAAPSASEEVGEGDGPLTLAAAIDFALRNNPRLRQASARVRAARAGEDIAFAPFLPDVGAHYRYSAFNVPVIPGGTFVPASLNGGVTNFSIAEAGVQWTLYDFGRTAGRYGQAVSQTQIEQLNFHRAKQTIAFEVARAYFRLLSARAVLRVREEALRQGESILKDTRVRRENGVADREAVLRAEVVV